MSEHQRTASCPQTEPGKTSDPPVTAETADGCTSRRSAEVAPDAVERVDGHVVIVPVGAGGDHMIDFTTHTVERGQVLHLQPGQVQRWLPGSAPEAVVITIAPEVVPTELFDPFWLRPVASLGAATPIVEAVARDLLREHDQDQPHHAIMVTSAVLLLHHVATAVGPTGKEPTPQVELLRTFRAEVETSFAATRSVTHYARTIGISPKTLSRATSTVTGRSPKEIIDHRVTLEARRLLAHTTESASSIGAMLGFSEPTNFTKFFVRQTGMSPQEFRVGI